MMLVCVQGPSDSFSIFWIIIWPFWKMLQNLDELDKNLSILKSMKPRSQQDDLARNSSAFVKIPNFCSSFFWVYGMKYR